MRTLCLSLAVVLAIASVPDFAAGQRAANSERVLAALEKAMAGRCERDGTVVQKGVATNPTVYKTMSGFARYAGTTGGAGRHVFSVTTTEDSRPGESAPRGSLREAVGKAKAAGGGWIVFSLPKGARIDLQADIRPADNTTIDGGCSDVMVTSMGKAAVIVLRNVSNIVLTRMRLRQREGEGENQGDCISVGEGSDRVWIAYNDLKLCGDGLVDVTGSALGAPQRVTVAHNRFAQHDKAMLIATLDCQPQQSADTCTDFLAQSWSWSKGLQVTVGANVFAGTGQRHPRLSGLVYVHMLDNVIAFEPVHKRDGTRGASYGSYVGEGARFFADSNLYIPLGDQTRPLAIWNAQTKDTKSDEGPGSARVRNAFVLGQATIDARNAALTPLPPYPLQAGADFSKRQIESAMRIARHAGPSGLRLKDRL